MWRRNRSAERDSGSLRRPVLASVVALGSVITLAGTTGVFAVFSDRATTGGNSVTTKALARSADLVMAFGDTHNTPIGMIGCGTYSDDLETGVMTASDVLPGAQLGSTWLCVKNIGSQSVDVTASAIGLTDLDVDCTGDESVVDTTCGLDAIQTPQAGELSPLLHSQVTVADCSATDNFSAPPPVALPSLTDLPITSLAPGAVTCLNFGIIYNPSDTQAQAAQSDEATWRYALDGTVPA